jgi:acyl dehydratase
MDYHSLYVGQSFQVPKVAISSDEADEFSRRYDPQGLHLELNTAQQAIYGGIIVSGFQTMAVLWRSFIDTKVLGEESLGGLEAKMKWKRAVYAGDELEGAVTVKEMRSTSREDRGLVTFNMTGWNQRQEPVLEMEWVSLISTRKISQQAESNTRLD